MDLTGKRILVTGADGFIGSHLTEMLVDAGYKVKAFVYYNSFNSWGWLDSFPKEKLEKIEIFSGDIRDPNGVRNAMKDVDVVFHLAALIAIPFSYHSPDSYVDTNIKGTLNVVQAARDLNIERVLVTSTSEVYGTAQHVPIDEKHPRQPQSPLPRLLRSDPTPLTTQTGGTTHSPSPPPPAESLRPPAAAQHPLTPTSPLAMDAPQPLLLPTTNAAGRAPWRLML